MVKKRVLIVEDEAVIALDIKCALRIYNIDVVDITKSHEETMLVLQQHKVELILMDINICGPIDGIQSCEIIHYKYKIPTIFISAHSDQETLELIKQSHALGYIVKPFKYEQLYMQMHFALSHTIQQQPNTTIKKINLENDFAYCIEKRVLYCQNKEINLTKKEKLLLFILCKNKNNYVSYESLFSQVWEREQFCLNKIRGSIFRIKRKLPLLTILNNKEHGYQII